MWNTIEIQRHGQWQTEKARVKTHILIHMFNWINTARHSIWIIFLFEQLFVCVCVKKFSWSSLEIFYKFQAFYRLNWLEFKVPKKNCSTQMIRIIYVNTCYSCCRIYLYDNVSEIKIWTSIYQKTNIESGTQFQSLIVIVR